MATKFKTIGVLGRVKNPGVIETLKALIHFLQTFPLTTFVETETAEPLHDLTLRTIDREQMGSQCDLLIVVGGDGSLLHAAHAIVDYEIPVLGINRGSLGFLTDVHPTELHKIHAILEGKYILDKRFLLTATLETNDNVFFEDDALNEIAIIPDMIPHMIEFEIYIDNQFVCSQASDGLIIATPTGSTAYALSGGGPILHPQLDAIVLVPMFPHSLSSRPIVIEGNRQMNMVISPKNVTSPRLSCDGRSNVTIPAGCKVSVRKKAKQLQLIHPVDYNYYEALRSKLHWGKKLHYSE